MDQDQESEQPRLLARRKSFRCPEPGAKFDSELRIAQDCYPVAVVDESSSGFGVVVEGAVPLKPDDSAWLRHRAGWSEVRVVHVSPEFSEDEAPEGQEASPRKTRLGLKRLRELEVHDDLPRSPWAALCDLRTHMVWILGSTLRTAVGGVIFAVLVVGIPAIVLATLFTGGRAAVTRMLPESHFNERLAELSGPRRAQSARRSGSGSAATPSTDRPAQRAAQPDADSDSTTSVPSIAAGPGGPGSQPPRSAPTLVPESMRQTIRRLPGASAFAVPVVARYLGLTPAQQEQIRGIVDETTAALKELGVRFSGSGRQATARYEAMLFERAREQAEALLNESQRARWRELVEQSGAGAPGQFQPVVAPQP